MVRLLRGLTMGAVVQECSADLQTDAEKADQIAEIETTLLPVV